MPFKSRAQQRWGHTAAGEKALGGAEAVHEWDEETPKRLPPRKPAVGSRRASGAISESAKRKFGSKGKFSLGLTGPKKEGRGAKGRNTVDRDYYGGPSSRPDGGSNTTYYGGPSNRSDKDDVPGVSR